MLQIFKTTRDIMSLWKLSTKQYRRNQEAIRATNRQSIHHLRPWNSQFSIERHDVVETLQNQKSEKTTDYLGSAKKQNYETIVERHLEDEKLQVGMHGLDSRNPTWKNLTKIASEKRTYVASSDERAHFRDQYKVVQPYQRRNSDTVQTEEHPEHEHIVSSGKKKKMTRQSSKPMLNKWSSWSSRTLSPSSWPSRWDSSSSQTFPTLVFNTKKNTNSKRLVETQFK